MAKSKAVADSRKKKGETANDLVREVHAHALQMLAANVKANAAGYKQLLVKLMCEGLVQVDEPVVTVECLASEADLISGLCADALQQYKETVSAQFQSDKVKFATQYRTSQSCQITISDRAPLPEAFVGGVRLVGDNGRIVCDNTLRARLDICVEEQLPAVRAALFPSCPVVACPRRKSGAAANARPS